MARIGRQPRAGLPAVVPDGQGLLAHALGLQFQGATAVSGRQALPPDLGGFGAGQGLELLDRFPVTPSRQGRLGLSGTGRDLGYP